VQELRRIERDILARGKVDSDHTLARHCEGLRAAVAAERERCATVMEGVFRDGGFPGFGPLADAIGKDPPH
jgi:hypothetical protein